MEEKNEIELRNELWDLFDELDHKKQVEWLLEFSVIFDIVKDWEIETLEEEIGRLRESVKNG